MATFKCAIGLFICFLVVTVCQTRSISFYWTLLASGLER